MTTTSEPVKEPFDLPTLSFSAVTSELGAARQFVRTLQDAAVRMVPEREWTFEDLRDIVQFAIEGGEAPMLLLEGRQFRRRLAEYLQRAERYDETFSVMVVDMGGPDRASELYASVVDGLAERLRRSDLVFLYKRRAAILLPHTGGKSLANLTRRIRELVTAVLGSDVGVSIDEASYPSSAMRSPDAMLNWVDERLRS